VKNNTDKVDVIKYTGGKNNLDAVLFVFCSWVCSYMYFCFLLVLLAAFSLTVIAFFTHTHRERQ